MKYKVTYPKIGYEKIFDNFKDAYLAAMFWASGDDATIEFELLEDNYPPEVEEFVKENGICEICDDICIERVDSETEPIYMSKGVEMLCKMFEEVAKENEI